MSNPGSDDDNGSSTHWEVLSMTSASPEIPASPAAATQDDKTTTSSPEASQMQWVKLDAGDGGEGEMLVIKSSKVEIVPWWKRQSSMIVSRVRQANALWSLAVAAAAVVGLVILGQSWHHERCQNQQLKTQICSRDEVPLARLVFTQLDASVSVLQKISQLILHMSRMKESISGRRKVPVVRPSSVFG